MRLNRFREKAMQGVFFLTAVTSIAAVVIICIFLFYNGVPAMAEIGFFDFVGGQKWAPTNVPASYGIFDMIIASIYVTAGAIIIGVPIGILTAVFLAGFCPAPLYKVLKPATELLAGIPSIVYGFFGLMVVVPFIRDTFGGFGSSWLAASIVLGVMILPTIIGVSESAIKAVPESYYEGALALGATKIQTIFKVTIPAAKSGIMTGIVLGIGRALGEAMAINMVAGGTVSFPLPFNSVRFLTTQLVSEMGYASGLHRQVLFSVGLVLFVFIMIINFSLMKLKKKGAVEND